jgi:very-short-patch-repair endonuclease
LEWHPYNNPRKDAIEGEYSPGNQISPSEITASSGIRANWLCAKKCEQGCLHEYVQRPVDKSGQSQRCPYCCNQKRCYHNSLAYLHPEVAAEWHPSQNTREDAIEGEYSPGNQLSPTGIAINSKIPRMWLCKDGCGYGCKHEWPASPGNRISLESKCPYCTKFTDRVCKHNSLGWLHPHLIPELDLEMNIGVDPFRIPPKSTKCLHWKCSRCGNKYESLVHQRANGSGCSLCRHKTEHKLYTFLTKIFEEVNRQFVIKQCRYKRVLPFDFRIQNRKVIVELDGRQHFCYIPMFRNNLNESVKRDVFKMQKAEIEGYKVIRISQQDVLDNDDKWLEENLLPHIIGEDRSHAFISSVPDMYDSHKELYNRKIEITLDESDSD